jgi:hypothetical protein
MKGIFKMGPAIGPLRWMYMAILVSEARTVHFARQHHTLVVSYKYEHNCKHELPSRPTTIDVGDKVTCLA